MTSWCAQCEAHEVLSPGSLCPCCDPRPYRCAVEVRMPLDPRTPSPATVVDEQAGGAA